MYARLFQKKYSVEKNGMLNPTFLTCLNGNDVISAKVSDHHPVLHQNTLFWNVMMQGRARIHQGATTYNNGFGFVETDKQYLQRLVKIAHVIAEIFYHHPTIQTIGLCEGPIQIEHTNKLIDALKQFPWMKSFIAHNSIHQPNVEYFPNWGLFMLCDRNFQVSKVHVEGFEQSPIFPKLANRFQIWKLSQHQREHYFALAHFPFGGDEQVTEKNQLSTVGNIYCGLINEVLVRYAGKNFILCADFNFNPYLIKHWRDRMFDQITHHNSIILTSATKNNTQISHVTVDGILLSAHEKQLKYNAHQSYLYSSLTKEYSLFKAFKTQENSQMGDAPTLGF